MQSLFRPSLKSGRNAAVRQLETFVVPDESTFYGIPRDFYKYEGTKAGVRTDAEYSAPEYIHAESSSKVHHAAIRK